MEATADDEEDENEAVEGKKDVKDDIAEAKDDIAEKGEDSQSDKDREDESVGEQLEEDGDEDSQTTKDRIDESEGEEKAEEEHDHDEEAEQKAEGVQDDRIGALDDRINGLTEKIEKLFSRIMGEEVEDGEDEAAFQAAAKRYGANAGVFSSDDQKQEKMTAKEAAEVFKNLKR